MCLFFGDLVHECDHAECQIVQTIKSLNQQSLFTQVLSRHNIIERENLRQEKLPSISNFIDDRPNEAVFKMEERDPPSMEYRCSDQSIPLENYYREKIERLEKEVADLKQLTYWMKNTLQKKGLL